MVAEIGDVLHMNATPERDSFSAVTIPPGLFSKTYRLGVAGAFSVAVRTPTQTVALLEGDSAEVWSRVFDERGKLKKALEYILAAGKWGRDPERESAAVLNGFILELVAQGLIELPGAPAKQVADIRPGDESAGRSTERAINLLMADNHVLYGLVVELTYRCNERCVHCYCPSKREKTELPLHALCDLLAEFQSMGGLNLQLTGGELLLRPEAKPLLRHLVGRGFVVSLISNLTLLDEEMVELLRALQPRSVGCSIYSAESGVHDQVTGVPGSFDRSIRAIRRLRDAGIPVVMKTPLMHDTVNGWKQVDKLGATLGCECQFDLQITAKNDGAMGPVSLRVHDEAAIEELFTTRLNRLHHQGEPVENAEESSADAGLCGAGAAGLSIAPDGTIHPCIGLPLTLGRFPENSLRSIWNGSPFFQEWSAIHLGDIAECRNCRHTASCFRCPGSWFVELGSYRRPNEYTCFLARIANQALKRQQVGLSSE